MHTREKILPRGVAWSLGQLLSKTQQLADGWKYQQDSDLHGIPVVHFHCIEEVKDLTTLCQWVR